MKRIGLILATLGSLTMACHGQTSTLRVFSEFTRIDPFGAIVPQDRGTTPARDILSPGVPRNAFSSLRIVVTLDKPATYTLDIGQNPENAVKATLYKERFEKHGDAWIPDGLEPVKIPYEGTFPGSDIPGQTSVTFWLDMWVDRNAPVDRIKVEPQLWVSTYSEWFTYPMEARVLETTLPPSTTASGPLPKVTERTDRAAIDPLRARFCGMKEAPEVSGPVNARSLIRRNVVQHLGFRDTTWSSKLVQISGAGTLEKWCLSPPAPPSGPEWYLKLRDSILQRRSDSQ